MTSLFHIRGNKFEPFGRNWLAEHTPYERVLFDQELHGLVVAPKSGFASHLEFAALVRMTMIMECEVSYLLTTQHSYRAVGNRMDGQSQPILTSSKRQG